MTSPILIRISEGLHICCGMKRPTTEQHCGMACAVQQMSCPTYVYERCTLTIRFDKQLCRRSSLLSSCVVLLQKFRIVCVFNSFVTGTGKLAEFPPYSPTGPYKVGDMFRRIGLYAILRTLSTSMHPQTFTFWGNTHNLSCDIA
jgi:hypothetical protein